MSVKALEAKTNSSHQVLTLPQQGLFMVPPIPMYLNALSLTVQDLFILISMGLLLAALCASHFERKHLRLIAAGASPCRSKLNGKQRRAKEVK
jgi:hypothetical protein